MKNQIYTVCAFDVSSEGYGIAKIDSAVVFVKGLLAGETARIKIIKSYKNYHIAIIEELLIKNKHRQKSLCPLNFKCGGCIFWHLEYAEQLKVKRHLLEELVKKDGLDLEVEEVVSSKPHLHFRNKVQIPIKDGKMGFYRAHSHDIIENDYCLIQSETANMIINYLKSRVVDIAGLRHILIKEGFKTGQVMVAFISLNELDARIRQLSLDLVERFPMIKAVIFDHKEKDDNVILGDREEVIYGQDYIVDELGFLKFKIALRSFYQINPYVTPLLYEGAISRIDHIEQKKVLDLYSGIGTISLFLALKAKHVLGVEIVKEAVLNAKDNALMNQIKNVEFICEDAKNDLDQHLRDIDAVVVDPPRKGLHHDVIKRIANAKIQEIVYISCNPKTLLRDIKLFQDLGYSADHLSPYDMFPGSKHLEVITKLKYRP